MVFFCFTSPTKEIVSILGKEPGEDVSDIAGYHLSLSASQHLTHSLHASRYSQEVLRIFFLDCSISSTMVVLALRYA